MTKQEIRKKHLALRADLKNRPDADKKICSRFLSQEAYKQAKTVMIYLSYKSEPDTWRLARHILSDGKRLCAPVCKSGGEMDCFLIRDPENLCLSDMGIYEPFPTEPVQPDEIDVIVVPGCAFSEKGFRIGYGGGYYDRYLPKTHAVTYGFFYECLKADFTPEPTDFPLHYIITEQHLYEKKKG